VTHRGGRERDPGRFSICSQNLLLRTANSQPSRGAIETRHFEPSGCCPQVGSAAAKTPQCHRHERHQAPVYWQHRLSGAFSHSVFLEQQNDERAHHRPTKSQRKDEFPLLAPCRPGPDVVAPAAFGTRTILGSPRRTPITPADTPPGHSCGAQGHKTGRRWHYEFACRAIADLIQV
jgi:hypothetical protein